MPNMHTNLRRRSRIAIAILTFSATPLTALAQATTPEPDTDAPQVPSKSVGVVNITGTRQPSVLPTQIPATMESVTRQTIERTVNATDSEDALKYLPSLLVRKRYVGDYNHAVLSSRASGTGNSARSAVYADGVLLSNFLGNGVGGLSFPPRWGLVSPQEIERVDVMYGPFSAAFPGQSVGAVVVYTTRMPKAFEVHAKVGYTHQPFSLYGTQANFGAWEASAAVGNRSDAFSWLLNVQRGESHGQPQTFATRLQSAGVPGTAGTPVTGAVAGLNNTNSPWYLLGSGTEYRTTQDQLKLKLALDITPDVRASYVLGIWRNQATNRPTSYLRDAAGQPVSSGGINIDGRSYVAATGAGGALSGADFVSSNERMLHALHGLTVKSNTLGAWDWEATASLYQYRQEERRQNAASNPQPTALSGGAGTLADGQGSGWRNLAVKGVWRPDGLQGAHTVDAGLQLDDYRLRFRTSNLATDWINQRPDAVATDVRGKSQWRSAYAQDVWRFAPDWRAVLGLRAEQWLVQDGQTVFSATNNLTYASRNEKHLSPKGAVSVQALPDLVLKVATGRAVRMPTLNELYGATTTANAQYVNDPSLKAERSWTTEVTAEKDFGGPQLRLTLFAESTRDALYAQTTFDANANRNISRVQNVDRISTQGLEAAFSGNDMLLKGLDLNASVTYARSIIQANSGFVAAPGDTLGKQQPNIPRWRATALASYRWSDAFTSSVGARYSGPQFRTLNNADVNGFAYQGVSKFFVMDLRLRYQFSRQWSAAVGVDNLNSQQHWNFHPYPQRSYNAELRFDL
jgi:iron complex outermembrane recepter protein